MAIDGFVSWVYERSKYLRGQERRLGACAGAVMEYRMWVAAHPEEISQARRSFMASVLPTTQKDCGPEERHIFVEGQSPEGSEPESAPPDPSEKDV
jgi:hypothetical protein